MSDDRVQIQVEDHVAEVAMVRSDKHNALDGDMFEAIADRRIKAVWIMCTNPLVSLPDADRVRRALDACELVVVSDCLLQEERHSQQALRHGAAGHFVGWRIGRSRAEPFFIAGHVRRFWCWRLTAR